MINQLCKKLLGELCEMANHSKYQAAYKLQSAPLDMAQVVAVKQLKLGDLCLQLRSAAEANVMRRYAKSWVGCFRAVASVRLLSWVISYMYPGQVHGSDRPIKEGGDC